MYRLLFDVNCAAVDMHGLLITIAKERSGLRISSVFVHIKYTSNMAGVLR